MPRFYIPPAEWATGEWTLEGAEAHHALGVLRLKTGDSVEIFNGVGEVATAEIIGTTKHRVGLQILQKSRTEPVQSRITLAQAIPKGKTIEWILEKATELGAAEIVPLLTERTVIQLDAREAAKKREKWQGVTVEACKQCGQNWLPSVELPQTLKQFFSSSQSFDLMLIGSLQADAVSLKKSLTVTLGESQKKPARVLILIGPEGDFTPAEIALCLGNGCRPVSLGSIVLRTETAAIYCLSVLGYELLG